jgi:hypothetical protein
MELYRGRLKKQKVKHAKDDLVAIAGAKAGGLEYWRALRPFRTKPADTSLDSTK